MPPRVLEQWGRVRAGQLQVPHSDWGNVQPLVVGASPRAKAAHSPHGARALIAAISTTTTTVGIFRHPCAVLGMTVFCKKSSCSS